MPNNLSIIDGLADIDKDKRDLEAEEYLNKYTDYVGISRREREAFIQADSYFDFSQDLLGKLAARNFMTKVDIESLYKGIPSQLDVIVTSRFMYEPDNPIIIISVFTRKSDDNRRFIAASGVPFFYEEYVNEPDISDILNNCCEILLMNGIHATVIEDIDILREEVEYFYE